MAAGTPRPRHWCGARAGVVALVLFLVAPAPAGTTTDAGFDQGCVPLSLLPEGERLALEDIAPTGPRTRRFRQPLRSAAPTGC